MLARVEITRNGDKFTAVVYTARDHRYRREYAGTYETLQDAAAAAARMLAQYEAGEPIVPNA